MDRNKPADTPWHTYQGFVKDNVFRRGRTVCSGEHGTEHAVAYCDYMWPERAEANAALIVRAVNNFEPMLAALRLAANDYTLNDSVARVVDEAIERAEQQPQTSE